MKRDENFLLYTVAGQNVVVPVGEGCAKLNGMLTLNDTGRFLWELLAVETTEQALAEALHTEYQVAPAQAEADVAAFLSSMREAHCLVE